MLDFPLWKRVWLWGVTLVFALAAVPSLVSLAGGSWPSVLPQPMVNLGLDLAGGSHILLEANPDQVARQRLETKEEEVRNALRDAEPRIRVSDMSAARNQLSFVVEDPKQVDAARGVLEPLTTGVGYSGQRDWTIQVVDGNRFVLEQTRAGLSAAVDSAMDAATEVVRKRIDALGTREPTIIRQGNDRIVVDVPGLKDPQALKDLLGKTAELEFKLVDQTALQSDIQKGIAPAGSQIVHGAKGSDYEGRSLAVKRLGGIRGDLADQGAGERRPADQRADRQHPVRSARRRAVRAADYRERRQAVRDHPRRRSDLRAEHREPDHRRPGRISGGFDTEGANQLAIALNSARCRSISWWSRRARSAPNSAPTRSPAARWRCSSASAR